MSETRRSIVQLEALQESRDAYAWYHSRDPRVAERFRDAVEQAIEQIFEAPDRWPVYYEGTRHFGLRRFPYHIIYLVERDAVHILAIAHYRQRPGYWHDRRT